MNTDWEDLTELHPGAESAAGVPPSASIGPSDALPDWLPRTDFKGWVVPVLGGIPLLRLLGRGGMGAVYYGHNPRLDRGVAVKILPFQAGQMREATDRFVREAQTALEIRSPHLVRLYEIGEERGLLYLVFEYIDGCSAAEYLKRHRRQTEGGLPERDALEIVIAASRGLAELHARQIVHRDIKPANLFLVRRADRPERFDLKRTKLGDLGVVHNEAEDLSLTATNVALGTPGFMAPEQTLDAKNVGPAADVFSLGATLYTLLCGRPPFQGESHVAILMATVQKAHLPIRSARPDVSLSTSLVLQRCLQKHPGDRHQDGRELLPELLRCRDELLGQKQLARARKDGRHRRAALALWSVGRSGWTRLPVFGALLWCAYGQLLAPEHTSPLHRFSRALHDLGHALFEKTASLPAEILGGALLPFFTVALFLKLCVRQSAWFGLAAGFSVLGTFFHHAAQYLLTASVPGTAPGRFEAPGALYHDWNWILSRLELEHRAGAFAKIAADLGNGILLLGLFGCTLILWTLFRRRS